jgi:hypothetical protein
LSRLDDYDAYIDRALRGVAERGEAERLFGPRNDRSAAHWKPHRGRSWRREVDNFVAGVRWRLEGRRYDGARLCIDVFLTKYDLAAHREPRVYAAWRLRRARSELRRGCRGG